MSWSDDPSQVDSATLAASRDRDIQMAGQSDTELQRLKWLQTAINTQFELVRREGRRASS
jgi:hypothetical protein